MPMAVFNTKQSWGWPARILHWGIAGVILFVLGLGVYMVELMPDDGSSATLLAKIPLYQTHKSWGFLVILLVLARMLWRASNRRTPELPDGMSGWERRAAQGAHWALYILIIAVPVSGWLMVSASPLQDLGYVSNQVFGYDMPDPFPSGDEALEGLFKSIHFWLVIALGLVLVGHVGGALKHHFVSRDNVLKRMLFGR
jgi:cytochrome b561